MALATATGTAGTLLPPREAPSFPWVAPHPSSGKLRSWGGAGLIAACLGALYALGAWLSIAYQSPVIGATAFWPSAGLTAATLILTPRRSWPLWLVVFGAAEFTVDIGHHQAVVAALGFALANTLEPLVGASLFRKAVGRSNGYRARTVAFAVFPVAAGPLVGATVGATMAVAFAPTVHNWWATAATWWVGDALGVVVVGTAILTWWHWPFYKDRARVTSLPAITVLAAGTGGVVVATASAWHFPATFATLPVLVWAAFAGGPLAVTAVGVAVAGAADWAALTGRADRLVALASPTAQLTVLQAYLAVMLLTVLILAAEVAERRQGERAAQHAQLARMTSEQAAVALAEAERHSIAQDTHDIVGHGLTAMLLQLGAVSQVIDTDPQLARELLVSATSIGRGACDDLERALLCHQPSLQPGRGLCALPDLVGVFTTSGLALDLRTEGDRGDLSTLVDWSAYRIVQEALTNVARHAPTSSTTLTVRYQPHEVYLSVIDHGPRQVGNGRYKEGRGIIGMRERAAALGGTLGAGPTPTGFAVIAHLPRSSGDAQAAR